MRIKSAQELGRLVRTVRKSVGLTQRQLAGVSGVGVRFLIELENGKPTCELERTLRVLSMLGIKVDLQVPYPELLKTGKVAES